jgi:uncharacterized protein
MFQPFFLTLRKNGVPVALQEYLALLAALDAGLAAFDVTEFYHLARVILVKDERHFDRYDRAFAESFDGALSLTPEAILTALDIPADWLARLMDGQLTAEERAKVQAMGGFQALMDTLRQRLAEQNERHEGGSKWIGTAGTSPFGAYGFNPEGIRIGQDTSRQRRAVKVWDQRAFRDYDDTQGLGTRNLQVALRRLRRWAREGAEEFDLDGTIKSTAEKGWLDVKLRPQRRNAVRVVLFLDVGGSMDDHVKAVESLFSAARAAFGQLHSYYFHNCLYDHVWRSNTRRHADRVATADLLRSLGPDWRAIFVGDAAMSPYEITSVGGASEHWNAETGATWLTRAATQWPHHLWINPIPKSGWDYSQSTAMISRIFNGQMVAMTPDGLTQGMKALT